MENKEFQQTTKEIQNGQFSGVSEPPKPNWIPVGHVMEVIQASHMGRWDFWRNNRCKYIRLTIDMRDGHCVLMDKDGEPITLDELRYQHGAGGA